MNRRVVWWVAVFFLLTSAGVTDAEARGRGPKADPPGLAKRDEVPGRATAPGQLKRQAEEQQAHESVEGVDDVSELDIDAFFENEGVSSWEAYNAQRANERGFDTWDAYIADHLQKWANDHGFATWEAYSEAMGGYVE
jgi:hypothetical protein